VLLTLTVRHMLLATWEVDPERVQRSLPAGLEPALAAGGRALVSIAAFRNAGVRLSRRRVPGYSQLNVRSYVTRAGEPAIFLLSLRVTLPGLGGVLFGAPSRPARIRVREGAAEAPGLGVSFGYRRLGEPPRAPALPGGPLGSHDVGYFFAAGLRRLVARHDPFAWEAAELTASPRLDPLLGLGFDVREPDSLLYAASTAFSVELPPERVA
jgi:hypothetical protein